MKANELNGKDIMTAFRMARNILGTAGLVFAGFVILSSLKDSMRYMKISRM
jgi:hypothetical protein